MKVYIKNPAPQLEGDTRWGDDYFGRSLAEAFESHGCEVVQEYWPDWVDTPQDGIVLVLRGLRKWKPPQGGFRVLWLLSHPLNVDLDELAAYDLVLVASRLHARLLADISPTPVELGMQCTDPSVFSPSPLSLTQQVERRSGIIYVANSRGVRRDMAQWIDEIKPNVEVYGRAWSWFDLGDWVKADHIPNSELGDKYRNARLALNDHWLDMRGLGYVNNRIFDCLSCGVPVLSDDSPELRSLFGDALLYAGSGEDFKAALDYCDQHYYDLLQRTQAIWREIGESYTFSQRCAEILAWEANPPSSKSKTGKLREGDLFQQAHASLRSAIEHEEQRSKYYENRLKQLRWDMEAAEKRTAALDQRQERTTTELNEKARALRQAQAESGSLSRRAVAAEARLKDVEAQLKSVESRLASGQEQWARAAQRWDAAARQVESANREVKDATRRAAALEGELKVVREKLSDTSKLHSQKVQELDKLAARYAELERRERDTQTRILEAEATAARSSDALGACQAELKTLEQQLQDQTTLEQNNRMLSVRVESLMSRTSAQWQLAAEQRRELSKYIALLENRLQAVLVSSSWRVTSPLRGAKLMLTATGAAGATTLPARPPVVDQWMAAGEDQSPLSDSGVAEPLGHDRNQTSVAADSRLGSVVTASSTLTSARSPTTGTASDDTDYWRHQAYSLLEELESMQDHHE